MPLGKSSENLGTTDMQQIYFRILSDIINQTKQQSINKWLIHVNCNNVTLIFLYKNILIFIAPKILIIIRR